MKLYIKEVKKIKTDTVASILEKILNINNRWQKYSFPETFYDKECKNTEFYKAKYRSFEVIVAVLRSYFPNVTEKTVAKELKKILETDPENCCFLFCAYANKWIFHVSGKYWKNRDKDYCVDYNGRVLRDTLKDSKGCGKYTLKEIIELMNKK